MGKGLVGVLGVGKGLCGLDLGDEYVCICVRERV